MTNYISMIRLAAIMLLVAPVLAGCLGKTSNGNQTVTRRAPTEVRATAPDVRTMLLIMGMRELEEKKYPQAAKTFATVLEVEPKDLGALAGLGFTLFAQRKHLEAEPILERFRTEARAKKAKALPVALSLSGDNARLLYKHDEARAFLTEALALYRKSGKLKPAADANFSLGRIARQRAEIKAASQYFQEALKDYQKAEKMGGVADVMGHLGETLVIMNKFDAADQMLRRSIALSMLNKKSKREALSRATMAHLMMEQGKPDMAEKQFGFARERARETGDAETLAVVLTKYARFLIEQRRYEEAEKTMVESSILYRKTAYLAGAVNNKVLQGDIRMRKGDLPGACTLWRQAADEYDALGDSKRAGELRAIVQVTKCRLTNA